MRVAAIDVGSNTIRMLIGDVHGNILSRRFIDRAITRLAEGIGDSGMLLEKNMEKSIRVLKGFSSSIEGHSANCVSAVGTSALRQARNSQEFIDAVLKDTGIRINTISGIREAELTAKGVLLGFAESARPLFIVDIGGGSTEWIMVNPGRAGSSFSGSLQAGVVDLFERFAETDPLSPDNLRAIYGEIDSHLSHLMRKIPEHLPSDTVFVGTGGTVTTLASLDLGLRAYDANKIHMHTITAERLHRLRDLLLSLPLCKRKEMDGLEPERADLIIPGILLTIKFMDFFGFSEITVSDYGLLEGLLKEANE